MEVIQRHRSALLITCLFVALGVIYSVASPLFEPSDEHNHYPVVQHLATGGGLPIQRAGEKTLWGPEASQPPLYYAASALLTSWINTDDMVALLYRNPHDRRGVPGTTDNANMFIHTEREAFPWRDTALAVHLIRLFSVVLGAGTILCTYTLAFWLFPGQPAIAAAAMAINAFLPMFIFISASVNNDNLVIFLSSLVLLLLVRVIQRGASAWLLLGLGGLIGLASLAKLNALGLLPLACLALALRAIRVEQGSAMVPMRDATPRERKMGLAAGLRWIGECALVIGPAVLVAGWWYARNWQLYGDLLGLNAMVAVAGGRPPLRTLADLLGEFRGFRYSFWGVLGGFNILLRPPWVYALLDLLSVAALLGLAAWVWRTWRRRMPAPWPELLLLAAWIGVEAVALLRWTAATLASQGRLMFATLVALCFFLALGLIGWLPARRQRVAAWGVGGLMFLLAASAPFAAILPAYAPAPLLTAAAVPASAQRFDVDYGGVMRLLAFEVGKERVQPGAALPVTLYWQMLAPTSEDFSIYLQLFGWQQALGQRDSYPGGGARPTSRLAPGQVVADTYLMLVRPDAKGPAPAWISAGLYRLSSQEKLPATDSQGKPVVFPILTKLGLDAPAPTLTGTHPLAATLDGRVRLTSYDLADSLIRAGQEMTVTLYWQATAPLDADYKAFVHLRDAGDGTVAQADAAPLQGFYPTTAWQPGEILNDTQRLALPADLQPGKYRIVAGLYDAKIGQRLSVLDAAGKPAGNEVGIAMVEVAR
ncbi:MAG: exosortase/archaeosortase family protein [Anaerolineae bacterium]|nr:exosortase/archaeosortase family protein [Anaerolineae bacterium]